MSSEPQTVGPSIEERTGPAPLVAGLAFKVLLGLLVLLGIVGFGLGLASGQAGRAWQAYLVNLLVWLGIAQGDSCRFPSPQELCSRHSPRVFE